MGPHCSVRWLEQQERCSTINSYNENYIYGIEQTRLSKATYNKLIRQKKEKQTYITFSRVKMFIERVPSTYNR
jgi:hypothetical protein